MASPPQTRPGGRTARNSDQIREATLEILREKGFAGLSFQEVAERAGVNRTTLHRRWASRAEMAIDAMRATAFQKVAIADTGSLEGDLRAVLTRIGTFIAGPIGSTVLIATLEMRQQGETAVDSGLGWAERARDVFPIFERAIARGELPEDFDAEAAFAMAAGALYFRLIVMGFRPERGWTDRTLRMLLETLPQLERRRR